METFIRKNIDRSYIVSINSDSSVTLKCLSITATELLSLLFNNLNFILLLIGLEVIELFLCSTQLIMNFELYLNMDIVGIRVIFVL